MQQSFSAKIKEAKMFWLTFIETGPLLFQFSIFITNLISKPNPWK
tara:strand:+ start:4485 stop:4619 length:135 start_codon:yes stop_codon:yes gene_type:complete